MASTVAAGRRVVPSANWSAPVSSQPSQWWRVCTCTPNPASRPRQARNSGLAFMAFGNTRPELPVNTSCPRSRHHCISASGGKASKAGRSAVAAVP